MRQHEESVRRRTETLLSVLEDPLPPMARALAVLGGELAPAPSRQPFVALRPRIREEQGQFA